jgi:CheY-like chemotaxis protein
LELNLLYIGQDVRKERAMTATGARRSRYRYRVLCVEDNEFDAYVEATILRREGYEVLACSDALEAAAIAKAVEIDLAVLSYRMPVLNGAQLAALCKTANPDMKVILRSESTGTSKRELALADLFLRKSADIRELLDGVETLLLQSSTQALVGFGNEYNTNTRTEN